MIRRKLQTALAVFRDGGLSYAAIFTTRRVVGGCIPIASTLSSSLLRRVLLVLDGLDARWLEKEQRYGLVGQWTVSARAFTARENRKWWDTHDWCQRGEEWTPSQEWKAAILGRFLLRFAPHDGVILEIGPGDGRWTAVVADRGSSTLRARCRVHTARSAANASGPVPTSSTSLATDERCPWAIERWMESGPMTCSFTSMPSMPDRIVLISDGCCVLGLIRSFTIMGTGAASIGWHSIDQISPRRWSASLPARTDWT